MRTEQALLLAAGAIALVSLVVALLALVAVARVRRDVLDLAGAAEQQPAPAAEAVPPAARTDEAAASYVITHLGEDPDDEPAREAAVVPGRIEGRLFADLVARETVVKAGGLVHGVRRVLDPEVRHRIRFEMRREVKRARRQRRADLKAALRDLQDRQRATVEDEGDAA